MSAALDELYTGLMRPLLATRLLMDAMSTIEPQVLKRSIWRAVAMAVMKTPV